MAQGAGEGVAGPSTVGPPDTSTLVIPDLNLTDESVSKRYNDLLAKRNDLTRLLAAPGSADVMRSSQVDASRLDEELSLMLREQFLGAFSLFPRGTVTAHLPEIQLALDALIFYLSVWKDAPLPGMALMNLRFRDERAVPHSASGVGGPGLARSQKAMYGLGAVLLRYAWARTGHAAASGGSDGDGGWRATAWQVMRRAETAYRLAALVNAIAFLRAGKYRTLLERLIGARPVYVQTHAPRAISYEYLNRQLVWGELSELLLFVLPLFNLASVKRSLRRLLPQPAAQGGASGRQTACGTCGAAFPLLTPAAALPCGHVHCYYCLRARTQADALCECGVCGRRVQALCRLGRGQVATAPAGLGGVTKAIPTGMQSALLAGLPGPLR
ncbi:hypothetical protein ACKKBG_A27485 [Auxenochlorella protothecoides x Auxenochlorella symbiontica]